LSGFESERDAPLIALLASRLGREVQAPQVAALCLYVQQVANWNRKINLTAARDPRTLVEVLLADALMLADTACVADTARLVDVGTGAGAPIVALLALRPDLSADCIEPLRKRATFLRTLSARLALLDRMRVREATLDLDEPVIEGRFDLACSRATFAPADWLRIGLKLAPQVLVLTASSEPPPAPAGVSMAHSIAYTLPFSGAPRRIALFRRDDPAR
jgi:16S rRNA (guanine527-N7)-methyltransferase